MNNGDVRWILKIVIIILAFALQIGLSQGSADLKTKVDPMPGEDILQSCQYKLAIPESSDPFRAAWVIFDRGLDFTTFFQSRQVRAFAGAHRLALVLALHCRSKQVEDMNVDPTKGIGRALFTALAQFATSSAHPELRSVPLIAMGWSGAGSLVGRLAGFQPNRFLAGVLFAPGQYEPLGMDTIDLTPEASRKPQLIIAGGSDDHVGTQRPYRYFKKYFNEGAPWTFAIQNKMPHCCLQNAQDFILEWLDGILNAAPHQQQVERFGNLTVEQSPVVDGWKQHTFNAIKARVGSNRCQPRNKELCAGWLPSSSFAQTWLTLVLRPEPVATWKP